MTDAAPPPVEQAVLDDLRSRLHAWRRVELTGVSGWDRGTEPGFLADLITSWADDYDWREHEQRIRALPWERTSRMRLVHQRAAEPAATAVVLLQARRSVAEAQFDLRAFEHGTAGGHFAAWERPEEFVGSLRTAVALSGAAPVG